jgi:D-amino-acid dehydrogenase
MRIAVLGAGIVGVTTAYELATDGHEVVVIDRQDKAAMETSFSNAGMVSPGHAYTWASPRAPKILWQSMFRDDVALRLRLRLDPAMWRWCWRFLQECTSERAANNTTHKVRLCLYSQRRFAEINAGIQIDYDRRRQGAIYVYRDKDHLDRGISAMHILTDNGVTLRPVSTEEAVDIEPALAPDSANIAGAIFCPTDESGDCHKFANALALHSETTLGVTFRWSTEIQRIVAEGDRIRKVETDKGPVTADAFVLALGSYSPALSRQIGLDMKLSPNPMDIRLAGQAVPVLDRTSIPQSPAIN